MDARLNLDQLLMQGLIPEQPQCYCYDEPAIDCPDHGSIQYHVAMAHQTLVENFLLATVIRDVTAFANQLLDGGDTTVGQHLLHLLAQHLDLTPEPVEPDWLAEIKSLPWGEDPF